MLPQIEYTSKTAKISHRIDDTFNDSELTEQDEIRSNVRYWFSDCYGNKYFDQELSSNNLLGFS